MQRFATRHLVVFIVGALLGALLAFVVPSVSESSATPPSEPSAVAATPEGAAPAQGRATELAAQPGADVAAQPRGDVAAQPGAGTLDGAAAGALAPRHERAEDAAAASGQGERGASAPRQQGGGALRVLDAALTTGVERRQPLDRVDTFDDEVGRVWAWVRVRNSGAPTQIEMVWRYEGVERARVALEVGQSGGWRTWSNKRIMPHEIGFWTIDIVDAEGAVLETLRFEIAEPGC